MFEWGRAWRKADQSFLHTTHLDFAAAGEKKSVYRGHDDILLHVYTQSLITPIVTCIDLSQSRVHSDSREPTSSNLSTLVRIVILGIPNW